MKNWVIRKANGADLDGLEKIETAAFAGDRLSRASLRRWIHAPHSILQVVQGEEGQLLAYALVWLHHRRRVARLYSIAVRQEAQGLGLAKQLLRAVERAAAEQAYAEMRLEVAQDNLPAIKLYQAMGYQTFAVYEDYYENHQAAWRMQKAILPEQDG